MSTIKVFGPPGCGKTRYLLEKFEDELKTISPKRIAFLTFTRAARETALERSGRSADDLPYLRTIHAICYRQLGMTQGQLMRDRDIRNFGKALGIELTGQRSDPWSATGSWTSPGVGDVMLQLNHVGRHRQIKLKEAIKFVNKEVEFKVARRFTLAYREWKNKESLLDFTDLLTEYLEFGKPLDIDAMFVDEAQDLSALQWDVVEKLGSLAQRVYLAGDDDQAIFTWAGADPSRFIYRMAQQELVLEQSHRLPRLVYNAACSISARIKNRRKKDFRPRDTEGEFRGVGTLNASLFSSESFLLFRNHVRGQQLAQELENLSIPFMGELSFLSRPLVNNCLHGLQSWLRGENLTADQAHALVRYASPVWLMPDVEAPAKSRRSSIRPTELFVRQVTLEDWPHALNRLPHRNYFERCVQQYGWNKTLNPTINLISIHQSKGREVGTVVLDLDMTRRTYETWLTDPDDEHRVWYVGATRARERLFTLLPTTERSYQL